MEEMLKKYEDVFKDMVQCRIEDMNYDLEENEPIKTITENEKEIIAHKMIYDNDYLWEIINSTIDEYINRTIANRNNSNF